MRKVRTSGRHTQQKDPAKRQKRSGRDLRAFEALLPLKGLQEHAATVAALGKQTAIESGRKKKEERFVWVSCSGAAGGQILGRFHVLGANTGQGNILKKSGRLLE